MYSTEIIAMVLAAGQAKRMGRIKQLLQHQGRTLLQKVVDNILPLDIPIMVVLGAYHNQISESVDSTQLSTVINHNWEQGIGSSISTGLKAAKTQYGEPKAVLIALADQPDITVNHFRALIRKGTTSQKMVATRYGNTLGVPAYFPSQYFNYLTALKGDQGAKQLFLSKPGQLEEIVFEPAAIDIDTEQDWQHYINRE
jgi:molybdenum cofactor cytidylyltransferase